MSLVRQAMNYAVDKTPSSNRCSSVMGRPPCRRTISRTGARGKYGYALRSGQGQQTMAKSKYPHGLHHIRELRIGRHACVRDDGHRQSPARQDRHHPEHHAPRGRRAQRRGVAGKIDMWYNLGTGDIYDPAENLHFEMLPPSADGNAGYTGWSNPTVTKLVLAAEQHHAT